MSKADEDRALGEQLVTTGKLTSDELLACFEVQQQVGGPAERRLLEILVERGHITPDDLDETRDLTPATSPPEGGISAASSVVLDQDHGEEVNKALSDPRRRIGRYVLLSKLGRGGMGVVYRGYDPQLRREVAIKMIVGEAAQGDQGLARFIREAQACAKLHHPGIVAVHEAGNYEGQPYIVMDLVRGRVLAEVIEEGDQSPRSLAGIIRDLSLALQHAHSAGIIHRDIKPQNVVIDEDGRPLLMDFGLARDISVQQELTKTGEMLGTPHYMAPEQVEGSDLGPWTDLYALGAVLYMALTGKPPFEADTPVTLFKRILMDDPKPPREHDPDIHPDLETIALKCLAKEPDRRYASAGEVAEELSCFLEGRAIAARPMGRGEKMVCWIQRNRLASAALAGLVLVLIAAVVGGVEMQRSRRRAELETARREGRAKERAEQTARHREAAARDQSARAERERLQAEALETLRREVEQVLSSVRTGETLALELDRRATRARLLKHRDPETVRILARELRSLADGLAVERTLSQMRERYLHLLIWTLAEMGLREGAVSAIGGYLETEYGLPQEEQSQQRAVPAGLALCLLGGEEADRLLGLAKEGFGAYGSFWRRVSPETRRTGVNPELAGDSSLDHLGRAERRVDRGNYKGAIDDYTRALELDPGLVEAKLKRSLIRLEVRDYATAIDEMTQLIESRPELAAPWAARGEARIRVGDMVAAESDLNRAVQLDPLDDGFWLLRGNAKAALGDMSGAVADYTHAMELAPELLVAKTNRASARLYLGEIQEAIEDCDDVIRVDSRVARVWEIRAQALHRQGDLSKAIANYTRAIEIDPRHSTSWANRGAARGASGELVGAISDLEEFLRLEPDASEASKVRTEIERLRGQLKARAGAGK